MLRPLPIVAALALAACTTGPGPLDNQPLPGVSDMESSFLAGTVRNVYRGDGDVIFVQAGGRWYRTLLNAGCMDAVISPQPTYVFDSRGTSKVDRFTRVRISDGSGTAFSCQIQSIRQSDAPPMVDANSVVPRG